MKSHQYRLKILSLLIIDDSSFACLAALVLWAIGMTVMTVIWL